MENDKIKTTSSRSDKHDGSSAGAETWSYTDVNVVKFNHTWTISNFSFCSSKPGEKLESKRFMAGGNYKDEWILQAYPRGNQKENENYLSIFLQLASSEKEEIATNSTFFIIDSKGVKANVRKFECSLKRGVEWGWPKFIERDCLFIKANDLLSDDKLTIFCEIIASTDTSINTSGNGLPLQITNPASTILENQGILFDSQKFSDVVVTAGGKLFQVHKAMLAAHSPVFAAMFEHNMEERESNLVKILDMEDEVIEEMLRFMYTGKAANIEKMADDLIAAADKYQLAILKLMCQESLYKNLTIENAAHTFFLADLHSADWLKEQTLNFIRLHTAEVMGTEGYKSIETSHPRIVVEMLSFVIMKKSGEADESIISMVNGKASQSPS